MIVIDGKVSFCPINDQDNTFFDILESLEGLQEILG